MKLKINDSTLEVIQGDITEQNTEAIVNAANNQLAPGGGVAGAIHRAAGPELWEKCKKLGGCETGEAKITHGYNLPASHVIHTVGPVYSGAPEDPKLLTSCYRESLKLAEKNHIESISFPAISTGAFGYPMEEAARVALRTIMNFLKQSEVSLVRLVLYDSKALKIHETVLKKMKHNPNEP
ncbi:MAG: O-acetyl-ADP-ribose deacetylase [Candidatus Korarchaeota archaeon]|nr:O-acetyl-ADP-ribose deacetylase [Candidatus Korarchaeota archaeon]NIU82260.1 O-acetyl-ADP-ribose deacetylase [Candidatus Thorarchaeota archaeon]NIW12714.1 O-acetyl-ADP-ribose deacetylase [Candidatus Thorarchaeota archaeon]NIW50925.1 O-acetyl-ADP-ribose deacetylase [Candidatus Korarchaeota archaeon]